MSARESSRFLGLLGILLGLAACGGSGGAPEGGDPADEPPTIALTAPAGGTTVSGVVTIEADAADDLGVAGVTFTVDDAAVGSEDETAPYRGVLDCALHANGDHTVRATARDTSGQTTSVEVTVTVANPVGAKALLRWTDIEASFVGTFNVPAAQDGDYRFGYSNAVHVQLSTGNLIVMGHPWYPMQAEIQLPAAFDGSVATRVGDWFDVSDGLHPTGWDGGPAYVLGGMLEIGERLYFTKNQWYNGAGTDWETQGYRQDDAATGLWKVAGAHTHHSRVGGYVSYAPAAIRADGNTYLAGLEGTSGAALGRWGPNLFAIQHDETVPTGGSLPSQALICHDTEAHQPAGWWIGDKVTGMVWIETATHHAVLCLLHQKLGDTWYGEADVGGDPYGGGKGYHAQGYVLKAWIYDPEDLMAVYRGERDPWSLVPVEETLLTERPPLSAAETYHSIFTGTAIDELQVSLRDGRMIILQPDGYRPGEYEGMPKGYVFDLDG